MAANDAVSMSVAENRQNVPMAIRENRAAVQMVVAEGGVTPGRLNRKADKVTGAVAGNLAGLDANGNLTDSGKAPADFLEAPATAGSEGQVLTADGEGGASWQDPTGGDPTEIIDDNAGDGDTDKVWSADKSHELLTEINSKYEKPNTGIPATDMSSSVQTSLNNADSAYQKPQTGIPASDMADGVIPVVHNVPAGGSADMILRKASGTDFDMEWVNPATPTDAQVDSAVSDWLNEHPEATTTVEDGSISKIKLTDDVQDNSYGISADSYSKYNVLPLENIPTGTVRDVTITRDEDTFIFNGTATGTDSNQGASLNLIPGETYTIKVYTSSNKAVNISVRYTLSGVETNLGTIGSPISKDSLTFTVPNEYTRLYVKLGVVKTTVYSNDEYKLSISLGASNPKYVKYGEGVSAFDGYVRKELIGTQIKLDQISRFVTPEMFGAIGDGSANDTQAILDCISYAEANSVPIFGYKRYRVRQAITLSQNYMVVYLHSLFCNDDVGTLLTIKKSSSKIIIDFLQAIGTNLKALALVSEPSINTRFNYIQIGRIESNGNCIELYGDDTNGEPTWLSYNTFMLNFVCSHGANCIVHGGYSSENQFYNPSLECPNGWAFYNPNAARVFGASMENNVLNGIYVSSRSDGGGCSFIGCRHIELTDKLVNRVGNHKNTQGGTLIKFVGPSTGQFVYLTDCYVPYQAIDTSESTDFTDPTIDIDPPTDWYSKWVKFNTASRGVYIKCKIKYGMFDTKNGGFPIGDSMLILAGKKICKPVMDSSYKIEDADFDMRDDYTTDAKNYPYATTFVIGVADCVIHLASSYCCMGYNKLIIDQSTSGKLCTVYNSYDDQNPIFDGETEGTGVYELTCSCDLSQTSVQIPGTDNYYTGRNDLWTVRKLS